MKYLGYRNWECLLLFSVLLAPAGLSASQTNRIPQIEENHTFTLKANIRPVMRSGTDVGAIPQSFELPLVTLQLQRSAAQQRDLDALLQQQQDPKSSKYHKWLTPEEFASQFGVSETDLTKLKAWLESKGFVNIKVARTGTFITMGGTAAAADAAFHAHIHSYLDRAGQTHYSNSNEPTLPRALEGVVGAIDGLDDFRPKARVILRGKNQHPAPRLTSSTSGQAVITPADLATIYDLDQLYSAGLTGSGVKIAISGQTDLDMTQVQAFRSAAGFPTNTPQTIIVGQDPGVSATDQMESYLDVEWAGAMARAASIVYVASDNVFTSFQYIVDQKLAPIAPLTYGYCEAQFGPTTALSNALQAANAEGITVIAASGDLGAADCDEPSDTTSIPPAEASQGLAVDFPASSPYVTAVGGTEFNEDGGNYWRQSTSPAAASALSYIPEMVWNDTAQLGFLAAGGGGRSILFSKPSWQTGPGVPSDGMRDVPDLSLPASTAHDQVVVCASDGTVVVDGELQPQDCADGFSSGQGTFDLVGGTSVGPPVLSGIVALIVQQYGTQGNLNARLYELASDSSNVIHDITTGSNAVPCQQGSPNCPYSGQLGYAASTGYDQASGLGSVDAGNLVNNWGPNFSVSLTSTSWTLSKGQSESSTVTLSSVDGFSGVVQLSCNVSQALSDTTCSISPTATVPGTTTVTITRGNSSLSSPFAWKMLTPECTGFVAIAITIGLGCCLCHRRVRPSVLVLGSGLMLLSCGGVSSSVQTTSTAGTSGSNNSSSSTSSSGTSGTSSSTGSNSGTGNSSSGTGGTASNGSSSAGNSSTGSGVSTTGTVTITVAGNGIIKTIPISITET